MRIKLKEDVFNVPTGSPVRKQDVSAGQEIEVTKEIGRAMIDSGQASEVKRQAKSADQGPEETR